MSLIDHIQIIGHVCHDQTSDGFILGGTASYTAVMAVELCNEVRLLTSFGSDFLFQSRFDDLGVVVRNIRAKRTTVFENIYSPGSRIQYMHQRAEDISLNETTNLKESNLTLLCPIADEVKMSPDFLIHRKGLKAATVQGWLRDFDPNGQVIEKKPDLSLLQDIDVIIMSNDDIAGLPAFLHQATKIIPVVVVTHGADGAYVYVKGDVHYFPSFPTVPIDLTGAGDVFAIAFLCAYAHKRDILFATSMAHSAASLSIEGIGINSIPTLEAIQNRQQVYFKDYL